MYVVPMHDCNTHCMTDFYIWQNFILFIISSFWQWDTTEVEILMIIIEIFLKCSILSGQTILGTHTHACTHACTHARTHTCTTWGNNSLHKHVFQAINSHNTCCYLHNAQYGIPQFDWMKTPSPLCHSWVHIQTETHSASLHTQCQIKHTYTCMHAHTHTHTHALSPSLTHTLTHREQTNEITPE